jgi:hypothetical protein
MPYYSCKLAQSLKLESLRKWYQHAKTKNFPKDIPVSVEDVYKNEWEGWGNFLGTGLEQGQTYKNKFKKT